MLLIHFLSIVFMSQDPRLGWYLNRRIVMSYAIVGFGPVGLT